VTRALLGLLLAAAAVPCAQARDALQAIDQCLATLDSELDVGYARIAARCPDLTAALGESPWAQWLPADWKRPDNQLSAAGLSELRAQLVREAAAGVRTHPAPRTERVATVLAQVAHSEDTGGGSWWQRFKDWLRSLFATRAQTDDDWLRRALAGIRFSPHTTQLIAWGAFAVAVALAAGIVLNELRIAGFLRRRDDPLRQRPGAIPRGALTPLLAQIERASPGQQPALLLELIASRLAAQQRLPPARALTARELERQARLPEESGRARLAELVGVCERVRFSAEPVSARSLAAALSSGRALLAALDAAPPAAAAAEA
jgi:Domain of unknown function (DUF4129)